MFGKTSNKLPELELPLEDHATKDPMEAAAMRGVEALGIMVTERKSLAVKVERLDVDNALLIQENERLREQLTQATTERDHYLRHTVELVAVLNTASSVIAMAIQKAQTRAYEPLVRKPTILRTAEVEPIKTNDPFDPIPNFLSTPKPEEKL